MVEQGPRKNASSGHSADAEGERRCGGVCREVGQHVPRFHVSFARKNRARRRVARRRTGEGGERAPQEGAAGGEAREACRARAAHEVPRWPKVERRHREPRPPEVLAHQERRRCGGADGRGDEPLRGVDARGARVERREHNAVHGEAVDVGEHQRPQEHGDEHQEHRSLGSRPHVDGGERGALRRGEGARRAVNRERHCGRHRLGV